jgi:hypothetical protein
MTMTMTRAGAGAKAGAMARTRMCMQRGILRMGWSVSCRVAHAYRKIGMGSRGVLPGRWWVPTAMMLVPMSARKGRALIDAVMVECAADPDACRRGLRARRDARVRWPKCSESGLTVSELAVFGVRSLVGIRWGPLASTSPAYHHACVHALCGHLWPKTRRNLAVSCCVCPWAMGRAGRLWQDLPMLWMGG